MPDTPRYRYLQDDTGQWWRCPEEHAQDARKALDAIARYWRQVQSGDHLRAAESPNIPSYLEAVELTQRGEAA